MENGLAGRHGYRVLIPDWPTTVTSVSAEFGHATVRSRPLRGENVMDIQLKLATVQVEVLQLDVK